MRTTWLKKEGTKTKEEKNDSSRKKMSEEIEMNVSVRTVLLNYMRLCVCARIILLSEFAIFVPYIHCVRGAQFLIVKNWFYVYA